MQWLPDTGLKLLNTCCASSGSAPIAAARKRKIQTLSQRKRGSELRGEWAGSCGLTKRTSPQRYEDTKPRSTLKKRCVFVSWRCSLFRTECSAGHKATAGRRTPKLLPSFLNRCNFVFKYLTKVW